MADKTPTPPTTVPTPVTPMSVTPPATPAPASPGVVVTTQPSAAVPAPSETEAQRVARIWSELTSQSLDVLQVLMAEAPDALKLEAARYVLEHRPVDCSKIAQEARVATFLEASAQAKSRRSPAGKPRTQEEAAFSQACDVIAAHLDEMARAADSK